jgi:DNA-binding NarL/FixJ family response regulator
MGLALLLRAHGVQVLGTAETAPAATDLVIRRQPQASVIDASLGGAEPLAVARDVLTHWPAARILIYYPGCQLDPAHVQAGLGVGVGGFVSKSGAFEDLLAGIRAVADGQSYLDAGARREPGERHLTRREREILALLARGLTSEQVAGELFISRLTVHSHVRNLMAKLGASTRTHALALALAGRELELPPL